MRPILFLLALALFSGTLHAEEKPVDVVIVGAGLAGLSTAYRLQKAGLTYRILELSPHVGGRMRTATYPEGVSAELGLEELWAGNPTLEIVDELGLPKEGAATSFSSLLLKGKVHPYREKSNREFMESIFSKADMKKFRAWDDHVIELFEKSKQRPLSKELLALKDIPFSDWVKKKSGLSKDLQEFIRIEVEPEFATSWSLISALDGVQEWHIFAGNGTASFHIDGGNQRLAETIAKKIGSENISLNTKVTRIEQNGTEAIVHGVDQGNYENKAWHARYVVTTAPLFRLMEVQFVPALEEKRKLAIQSQTWGSYFTAHVIADAEAAKLWGGDESGVMPILTDGPLGVVYGQKPKDGSKYLILNLLVCGADAERFNTRASVAMDSVRDELLLNFEKQWPGVGKHIQRFEFYQYHPRAIASWPVGRSRLDELSDLMRTPQGRVYFAGDFTEGTHSDGAAWSAVRVVKQITEREKQK